MIPTALSGGGLVGAIDDRSAKGIAAAIGRLVSTGELQPGHRLPTVRELSRSLGVSPTTVSEAWQTLALVGAIVDGIQSTKFIDLTACSYTSNKIGYNFGEQGDYKFSNACENKGPFVKEACYCVSAGGKTCGTYSLSPYALKAKQNCANVLGNYANTLSASTAVCVILFIVLFFLSVFTCTILLCPHKSPIIVAQKKNEAERIDIGFDTTLV